MKYLIWKVLVYFDNIIPCGIKGKAVTSMHVELGKEIDEAEVKAKITRHFANLFESTFVGLDKLNAVV